MKTLPRDWQGQRVSVLGLARSGLALAQVLGARGAQVLISDMRTGESMAELEASARRLGAEVELGGHSQRVLDCDVMVISPGVSLYAPLVQQALQAGICLAGEVEIAYGICSVPLVAVTGTNGKSTTCSLLQAALGSRSRLAGNIGIPLVSEVSSDLSGVDYVVAEISSFQLETIHRFRPRVAVLTNISPDHLDRHPSLEEYIQAKARLFAYQEAEDWAVFNADDPGANQVCHWLEQGQLPRWKGFPEPVAGSRQIYRYSARGPLEQGCWWQDGWIWSRLQGGVAQPELAWDFPNLPGPHNLSNGLACFLVARLLGTPLEQIAQALRGYARMHYRLEEVGAWDQVRFINDSKATNFSSVESALQTFPEPVVLIAGGRNKGLDLEQLGRLIADRCFALVGIGEAGPEMIEWARRYGLQRTQQADSLQEAVEQAFALAPRPGVVLLSPACTSFDMFRNAEHRGEEFTACASRLIGRLVR